MAGADIVALIKKFFDIIYAFFVAIGIAEPTEAPEESSGD